MARLADECSAIGEDTIPEGTLRNTVNGIDPIRPGRIRLICTVIAQYGAGLSYAQLVEENGRPNQPSFGGNVVTHQNPDPHGTERVVGRAYAWEVGQGLRAEREKHGLTPAQVVDRSSAEITEDTLLAYENGTLPVDGMVVMRIYEAFDADPNSALLRANHRALARAAVLAVDLTALTDTDDDRLRPLQRWAAQRVRDQRPDSDATVRPNAGEWEQLAQLCGLDRADLVQLLFDAGIAT